MSAEKWLPVPGFVGFYEVSDHGRVKKIAPWCDGVNYYATRILALQQHTDGHFRVEFGKRRYWVHRLVMAAFLGPCPEGRVVNHMDGDPANNCFGNLEYVTPQENTLHARRILGRHWEKGSRHGMHKLIESQVAEIIRRSASGEPLAAIAKSFSVCIATISMIAMGRTWRHIKREALPDRRFIRGARPLSPRSSN